MEDGAWFWEFCNFSCKTCTGYGSLNCTTCMHENTMGPDIGCDKCKDGYEMKYDRENYTGDGNHQLLGCESLVKDTSKTEVPTAFKVIGGVVAVVVGVVALKFVASYFMSSMASGGSNVGKSGGSMSGQ